MTCLTSFQYLQVGVELYLASKLTGNTMSGRVQFVRYQNVNYTKSCPQSVSHVYTKLTKTNGMTNGARF